MGASRPAGNLAGCAAQRGGASGRTDLRAAGGLAFPVDRGIEPGVVVHLELAVDLEAALAARAFREQAVEAGAEVGPLLDEAIELRLAAFDMRAIDVAALRLQPHAADLQRQDG